MIDLKSSLPNYYEKIREMNLLMDVENKLFESIKTKMDRILNNQFILTCDIMTLYRYEQMLNIRPDAVTESIEFRRMRVINRLNSRSPFTFWFYQEALDVLFGKENNSLELDYNQYLLNIHIHSFDANAYNEFINHLRITMPANLSLALRLIHQFDTKVYFACVTVGGEGIEVRPQLVTEIEEKGSSYQGSITISGERVWTGPKVITETKSKGSLYQGATVVFGESVYMGPRVIREVITRGMLYQGLIMISGEAITVNPQISTKLESTGLITKGQTTVSGEQIQIYPKGVQ